MPRVQLEMPDGQYEELKTLIEECDLGSQKELFNSALNLFAWSIEQLKQGKIIAAVDQTDHHITEITMPAFRSSTIKRKRFEQRLKSGKYRHSAKIQPTAQQLGAAKAAKQVQKTTG